MECLADYNPMDALKAREIVEKIIPRLSHVNSSVVLTAIRVIII